MTLIPTHTVPNLSVTTVQGQQWTLSQQQPEQYTLVLFYRGLHCPKCKQQLQELSSKLQDFQQRGVSVVAISMDTQQRAQQTQQEWQLAYELTLGCELDANTAQQWGLFLSQSIGKSGGVEEPRTFNEPGLFLINADNTLFFSSVQNMPFARPELDAVLGAIDYIQENEYPARGTSTQQQKRAA